MEIEALENLRLLRQKVRLLHTRACSNAAPRYKVQVTIKELNEIYKLIPDLPQEMF